MQTFLGLHFRVYTFKGAPPAQPFCLILVFSFTLPPPSSPFPMHKLPSGCRLKMSHVYLKWRGSSGVPSCPTLFLWCFLTASQSWSHSPARLSVATTRGPKRHFTTMSVTSTVHTNQRVCLNGAQLQRRKRWRNDHGEEGKQGSECQSWSF